MLGSRTTQFITAKIIFLFAVLCSSLCVGEDPFSSPFNNGPASTASQRGTESGAVEPSVQRCPLSLETIHRALTPNEILIDANVNIAIKEETAATQKQRRVTGLLFVPALRDAGVQFRSGFQADGKTSPGENVGATPLVLVKARTSPEYQALLGALEVAGVGNKKGIADRTNLADAFFAKTQDGKTATYMTGDGGISKRLWQLANKSQLDRLSPEDRERTWIKLSEVKPLAFEVELNGRKLNVIGMPTHQKTLEMLNDDVDNSEPGEK